MTASTTSRGRHGNNLTRENNYRSTTSTQSLGVAPAKRKTFKFSAARATEGKERQ